MHDVGAPSGYRRAMHGPRVDGHGDPLPAFARLRLGALRWRHLSERIEDLVWSPDGATIYGLGAGVTAMETSTGRRVWQSADPGASFGAWLPSPDGPSLATVGLGGPFARRDARTGALQTSGTTGSTYATALATSPDGRTLAVGGFGRVGLLLTPDGAVRAKLAIDDGQYLGSVAFSPDGALLATTDSGGRASLWRVDDGGHLRDLGATLSPNDAAFTPDGARVVVATSSGYVCVYDVATGRQRARWKAHRASASSLAITPDGARVVTIGEDDTVSLWRLDDGARLETRPARLASPALALSPDGAVVAFGEGACVVRVDLARWVELDAAEGARGTLVDAVYSVDGRGAVTVEMTGGARFWRLDDGRCEAVARTGTAWSLSPTGAPDRFAVNPPSDDATTVLDLAARRVETTPLAQDHTAKQWWGPGGHAVMRAGRLTLTNRAGVAHTMKSVVDQLAFTRDGRHAVFVAKSRVVVWDLDAHAEAGAATVKSARVLALSPRGDEALVAASGRVHRVGVPDGVARGVWKNPPQRSALAVAWSPDGTRVALALSDAVQVLAHPEGRVIATLAGFDAMPSSVRFSPDGHTLLTASRDGTAMVWDVDAAVAGYVAPKPSKRKGA